MINTHFISIVNNKILISLFHSSSSHPIPFHSSVGHPPPSTYAIKCGINNNKCTTTIKMIYGQKLWEKIVRFAWIVREYRFRVICDVVIIIMRKQNRKHLKCLQ